MPHPAVYRELERLLMEIGDSCFGLFGPCQCSTCTCTCSYVSKKKITKEEEKKVEDPGIDPGTSRMLSERSTCELIPLLRKCQPH